MTFNIFNCQDELIHLPGKIQNFGYLLVFDLSYTCVAASENIDKLFFKPLNAILNNKIDFVNNLCNIQTNVDLDYLKSNDIYDKIDYYEIFIKEIKYQLSVYLDDEFIFYEIEINEINEKNLNKLQKYNINIENSSDYFYTLCESISDILKVDRVLVYQFLEDNSGIVISESVTGNLEPVLGYRYPEFDIPSQARKLYLKNIDRQTSNIYEDTVNIIGINSQKINLSKSKVRALSPVHLQYIANTNVTASASFSIIVDNKLWGLVCCQHQKPRYITIEERQLCLFLINTVTNIINKNQTKLNKNNTDIVNELLYNFKKKLYSNQNLYLTLSEFAHKFCYFISADGAIVYSPTGIYKYGLTPSDQDFEKLRNEIDETNIDKKIYTTHEFYNIKNYRQIGSQKFAGIARINFDVQGFNSIYFFRPEIIKEEIWSGEPEKMLTMSLETNMLSYSPRKSFDAWRVLKQGESFIWTSNDKFFLDILHREVRDCVYRSINENNNLNEQLAYLESTNKDAFNECLFLDQKYSDKINIVKKSSFFKKSIEGLTPDEINNYSNDIVEISILTDFLINKIIDTNLDKNSLFSISENNLKDIIVEFVNYSLKKFKINKSKISIGIIYPLNADNSLLKELFFNIIFNAVKFSSTQNIVHIDIYSECIGNQIIYFIKDNGIGMDVTDENIPFLIFKRLDNSNEYEGKGVGLATVKRIATRLNAQINFKSKVGEGTTFMITFPNE
jgi:two-component system, chemotaxis family, sensor kinase Cph1